MHETHICSLINYNVLSTRVFTIQVTRTHPPGCPSKSQPLFPPKTSHNPNVYCTHFLLSLSFSTYASPNTVVSCCHFDSDVNGVNHTAHLTWYLASFLVIPPHQHLEAGFFCLLFVLVLNCGVLFTYLPGYFCWCDDRCSILFLRRKLGTASFCRSCESCVWPLGVPGNPPITLIQFQGLRDFCMVMSQCWIQ